MTCPRTVVVGGGLAGLTAAHLLTRAGDQAVVLLEATDRVGGKLRGAEVAGVTVDVGAEAMLNRRPEGVDLAREVGLDLVHPAVAASRVWTGGALRPLPRTLMGIPMDLDGLAASGILSDPALSRVRAERDLGPRALDGDASLGDLVAERLGDEVVDLLLEPLLGGVYAGHARALSVRAALPQLVGMLGRGSLLEQVAAMPATYDRPVFAGIPGGMWRLAERLAADLEVRTRTTVRRVERLGDGFRLTLGSAHAPEHLDADRVVLATPTAPTARLLRDVAPEAAAALATIESASVAVVTHAFRADDLPDLPGSGFLVPPREGRSTKASTFSFAKWGWVREAGRGAGPAGEDLLLLRTSHGRHREEATLQVTDADLVATSLADLRDATGVRAHPVDSHVQRWGGGLPQYAVGHLDRVAAARAALARVPGLAACGAAYDGVGIPAVIGSARSAVAQVTGAQWPA